MTQIIYRVMSIHDGWCIECGGITGPPYNRKAEAVRDAAWVARELTAAGEDVDVFVDHEHGFMPMDWSTVPVEPLGGPLRH